ncbi:hypothetical protein [Actinosynnema sp. NPDC020468]|uniref:hypothetical protein n=1 Tax=Actinosynnema sp. NPDC020468 TaxID=3154488 RepID=UPI0033D22453
MELAELAEFCTDPATAGSYRWWRAGPWAGKSALMATFVLSPPAGVQVVSFFVTARLAGQSDRSAFVDNVLEQLVTLLDEQLPPFLTPATREAHLLGLLDDAAKACTERGVSLTLIVDGLDEDRGVTTGPDAYSIAGLLPSRLPPNMRVVVAGRPDPPVPSDVNPDHPLLDPKIVRVLRPSPQARLLRTQMENELLSLLDGAETSRDVLGLLTAAGGGLTAEDLSNLSKQQLWRVERQLHAVTGRSFTRRNSHLSSESAPEVYLLGHEQLQITALDMFGAMQIGEYRSRIHAWAAEFADAGWPHDTPEYLLRGYHTMLLSTGDLDGATDLCIDRRRHDRLFAVTGNDNTAYTQIVATLDSQIAHDPVNIVATARLALHRDRFYDRNSNIRPELPMAWADLGRHPRAAGLARSITDAKDRSDALRYVALRSAAADHPELAAELLTEAVGAANTITSDSNKSFTLRLPINPLTEISGHDKAIAIARSITEPGHRCDALSTVAKALSNADHQELAAELLTEAVDAANTITSDSNKSFTLRLPINPLTEISGHDKAIAIARSITEPGHRCDALSTVAKALSNADHQELAAELLTEAVDAANAITRGSGKLFAVRLLARPLAEISEHDKAIAIARSITEPDHRCDALSRVARALNNADHQELAAELLTEAVDAANTITSDSNKSLILSFLINPLAEISGHDKAIAIARSITKPDHRCDALSKVARALPPSAGSRITHRSSRRRQCHHQGQQQVIYIEAPDKASRGDQRTRQGDCDRPLDHQTRRSMRGLVKGGESAKQRRPPRAGSRITHRSGRRRSRDYQYAIPVQLTGGTCRNADRS